MNKLSDADAVQKVQTEETKPLTGVKQWAQGGSINFQKGCPNNCRYCYAKSIIRYKHGDPKEWKHPIINTGKIEKGYRKRKGRVFLPTSHDITPQNIEECLIVCKKLLASGNELLIVSKAHLSCIKKLCAELADYRDKITLRITIGSTDNEMLKFWEPKAPSFEERLSALKWAFQKGFKTGVSCEPMLDLQIGRVIHAVKPYVNDEIWLGRANNLRLIIAINCPNHAPTKKAADILLAEQTDEYLVALYDQYKSDPVIRFKDSICKAIAKLRPNEKGFEQWRKVKNNKNTKKTKGEKVMKFKQFKQQTAKTGKAVTDQDSQGSKVNAEKDLTTEYVNRLNEGAQYKVNGWLKQGEIIAEYIGKLQPQPKTKDEAYKKLASHPSSTHKVAQLRNYFECREIFNELGKDRPDMKMSYYIAVLSKKLEPKERLQLLKDALAKKMTVAQVKKEVRKRLGKDIDKAEKLPPTAEDILQQFESQKKTLYSTMAILAGNHNALPEDQKKTIKEGLKDLFEFALRHGYINLNELSETNKKAKAA